MSNPRAQVELLPGHRVLHMPGMAPVPTVLLFGDEHGHGQRRIITLPGGRPVPPETADKLLRVSQLPGWLQGRPVWLWPNRLLLEYETSANVSGEDFMDAVAEIMCGGPAWSAEHHLAVPRGRIPAASPMIVAGSIPGNGLFRYYRVPATIANGGCTRWLNGPFAFFPPELIDDPEINRLAAELHALPGLGACFRIEPEGIAIQASGRRRYGVD
jgi:hypothetical protein